MHESAAQAWLTRQCESIRGVTRGVLLSAAGAEPAARWPRGAEGGSDLAALANAALTEGRVVRRERPAGPGGDPGSLRVAVPLGAASSAPVVALEVADAKESELGPVVDLLRLGARWLTLLERREREAAPSDEAATAGPPDAGRLVTALELLALALEQSEQEAGAPAVATELATRLGCERVSLGAIDREGVRVEALSHSTGFDAGSKLARDLAAAMQEAVDQDAIVSHPASSDEPARITREHEALAAAHGAGAVLTVPLASGGRLVGALLFERPAGGSFDAVTRALCEDVATLLGPVFELQRRARAGPLARARDDARRRLTEWLAPDRPAPRILAGAALLLLLALSTANGDYRVTADATLEGRVQRAVVAGLEGFVAEANARAGDLVERGQVLGRLDDRDLLLERRRWAGRREELRKEYREALAGHDRAQISILSARIAQAAAQLELIEQNLLRTRLVAPFDGIVVRGDLTQALGSPVEKGQVLFEVAPLDGYRIILEVDERDVSDVAIGQQGRLALSALPGQPLPLTVERVTPVASVVDGRNVFRVEARLEAPEAPLRPGMEGVAKIGVDRRRLLWIWTHDLFDWIRLAAWSWLP